MKKKLAIVMTVMALLFCTGTITYAYSWVNGGGGWNLDLIEDVMLNVRDLSRSATCYSASEHSNHEGGFLKCGVCTWEKNAKPNGPKGTCSNM